MHFSDLRESPCAVIVNPFEVQVHCPIAVTPGDCYDGIECRGTVGRLNCGRIAGA
jgi:hypothetical protein